MPPHNATSWKKLVRRLAPDAEASLPAKEDQLKAIELSLGVELPSALREFLTETDGLIDDYGSRVVWPAKEIEDQNREYRSLESFRELHMPFDHLLFFGEDGGGDLFAFAIQADGKIHNDDIYRWEHETDARSWFAGRLEQYFELRFAEEE